MTALARTQSSSCADPKLDVFTSINGILTDVAVLTFQIWDKTTGTPVQVYPDSLGGKQPVNVTDDCPVGDRLSQGRYVARYTVPANANIGTFQVRWYIQLTPSISEQVFIEEFEVLPEIVGAASYPNEDYILVSDMRDEGVTTAMASDTFLMNRISLASRFVEAATRRYFFPKALTLRLDGTGGPKLFFSDPIIAIEYVKFEISPLYPEDFTIVETDILRVYNRHLRMNLLEPDDRNSPKIELFNPAFVRERQHTLLTRLNFPVGQQNVEVKGVFGYTDPDGTNTQGQTPFLIKHVTKLLVMRELNKITRTAARNEARNRFRVNSESTRDQSYTMDGLAALKLTGSSFTGDPEIDNILNYYMRPPAMGAT